MVIDRLIPLAEAFATAGLKVTKGYAEIAAGRLIATRNGRRTYVRASDLQAYIDALPRTGGVSSAKTGVTVEMSRAS